MNDRWLRRQSQAELCHNFACGTSLNIFIDLEQQREGKGHTSKFAALGPRLVQYVR